MAVNKINLAFGIHNHQPIGNFDFVFEQAYDQSYQPFLDVLEKHPKIRMTKHYSGILYDWIKENRPALLRQLKRMVKNGQVDIMSGGYYEPILTSIPERDIVGQIEKLSAFIDRETGFKPEGAWLTERVWEPYLPAPLARAGIRYTLADDSHFKFAGLWDDQLYGYYMTEHMGQTLRIFPISEKLRYTIPFMAPEKTIEYLQSVATPEGQRLIVFADDGEKFGVWPGTYTQCYENGWLDRFFSLVEENLDWINIITFSEALQQLKPQGRVYLPTASYREMMEWAMPAKIIQAYERFHDWLEEQSVSETDMEFVKGGFWRNFMAKYPEANNLQKRMLLASNRYDRLKADHKGLEQARDHIYAAQCNCPYWHGVFGGLYLPHLRYAIYNNLVTAEKEMDRAEYANNLENGWVKVTETDFDADGYDEVIVESDRMNLYFSPQNGGSLTELDYKPKAINLIDTMTRREEAYHQKLFQLEQKKSHDSEVASIHDIVQSKEEGLDRYLNYDWYRRVSLVDHFLHPLANLDSFVMARYGEQGDFVNQPYTVKSTGKGDKARITLERDGHVWIGSDFVPVRVSKTAQVQAGSDEIVFNYTVKNLFEKPVLLWFGVEFATALMAGNAPDRYYQAPGQSIDDAKLASTGEINGIREIALVDEWLRIKATYRTSLKADFWRFPIETISMSEAGFERVYQASMIMPHWKIYLEPDANWKVNIKERLDNIE